MKSGVHAWLERKKEIKGKRKKNERNNKERMKKGKKD